MRRDETLEGADGTNEFVTWIEKPMRRQGPVTSVLDIKVVEISKGR